MVETHNKYYYFQHATVNRVLMEDKSMLVWPTPEEAQRHLERTGLQTDTWQLRQCPQRSEGDK